MARRDGALQTTCSARVVDGAARGSLIGVLWGAFAGGKGGVLRAAMRNGADFGAFMALYSGTYCAASSATLGNIRASPTPSALAGAAAGAFLAVRSSRPPRAVLTTAISVAAVSVIIDGFGAGDVVNSGS